VIKDFACRETAKVFRGERATKFQPAILERVREQLFILAAAVSLNDLRAPPGNRLEAVKGDRKEQYSIRVNQAWRICFGWKDGSADRVELTHHYR